MTQQKNDPLRVAIVGTGPAGMYALEHLLREQDIAIEVDLFERLPTPWGLVRAGVAPDHPEKKLVTDRLFSYLVHRPNVRFFGNVEVGKDISHEELADCYSAVIYAVGANSDTPMNIPGEDLSGCWAAREFVAWYNGHPDFNDLPFDLSCKRAVIVGNGNVALDVARILTLSPNELAKTDIADHALEALRKSAIEEVVILGRRGFEQAAYHTPELEELAHLYDVQVEVDDDAFSRLDKQAIATLDWQTRRKVETLQQLVNRKLTAASKKIIFRFLASPVELVGDGKVDTLHVVRNALVEDTNGQLKAKPTDNVSNIETGLVLRAIGYRGHSLAGLPFDESKGVFENNHGRIVSNGQPQPGSYVTGWIKRGPKGIIGSNKRCAEETIKGLLDDHRAGKLSASLSADDVFEKVAGRVSQLVNLKGWAKIDRHEKLQGQPQMRPRVKVTDTDTLLGLALK